MILATDVQYAETTALAAGLLFSDWKSDVVKNVVLKNINKIEPYQAGAFYKRELPCILALLDDVDIKLDAIIIDGYVTLGKEEKEGLGMHLYKAIRQSTPIIGVAKKSFIGTPENCQILRGKSKNPLYITAVGLSLQESKQLISNMHGNNRLPTLLKKVDQLCRGFSWEVEGCLKNVPQ